jgi:hypothetical protein
MAAQEVNLTQEEIKEIEKEPGEIESIEYQIPNMETLTKLKGIIDTEQREKLIELLCDLSNYKEQSIINPRCMQYSTVTKHEMFQRRYHEIIKRKQTEKIE